MPDKVVWGLTGFALACVLMNVTLILIAYYDYQKEY